MAIDARVAGVVFESGREGPGYLVLEDRPAGKDGVYGIAGQATLHFVVAPPWVGDLVGCDIWGSSDTVIYRQQEIATRKGYKRVVFTAKKLHGLGPEAVRAAQEGAKLERWTKEELDGLLRGLGHAINALNGRCGKIEDTLIKAQSLALDHLNRVDPVE